MPDGVTGHPTCVIELWQAEWCPFSHRVRQRLTELGVDVLLHQVEPRPEQRDAMEAAVGARTIPVLVLDDGTILDEDADDIVAALDQRFPEPPLAAEHHERRLEARMFEP